MNLLYLSNIFNHHQKSLADCLYKLLGAGNYYFVETQELAEEQKNLGYLKYDEPYIIQLNDNTRERIQQMISDFEIVICGEAPLSLVHDRFRSSKITFRDDESRYKGIIKYLKWPIYTYASLTFNRGYLLSASAFGPADYYLSGMNRKKIFRWAYFPQVYKYNLEELHNRKNEYRYKHNLDISILWVGRLIAWKHPESTIILARQLKARDYSFCINILGTGPKEGKLKQMIEKYQLQHQVRLLGPVPSDRVRDFMLDTDISIITSDRREGWGAVVNESMNSGCAVVACENIGAVPYLIDNGISGLTFRDCDWRKMAEHVITLIDYPKLRTEMGDRAYESMINTWNAECAANNLLELIGYINKGSSTDMESGPCSPAPIKFRTSKWGIPSL